jgi:hypothetical protein
MVIPIAGSHIPDRAGGGNILKTVTKGSGFAELTGKAGRISGYGPITIFLEAGVIPTDLYLQRIVGAVVSVENYAVERDIRGRD